MDGRPGRALAQAAAFAIFAMFGVAHAAMPSAAPTNAEIERILAERIDFYQSGVGMVVGLVGPEGRRIVVHGVRDKHDSAPLTGDTLFEIGSVTKAFVGLLLEDMIRRGEVTPAEPINQLLPPTMQTPLQDGRAITLLDLATHTSGLPEAPKDVNYNLPNPVAVYTDAQFLAFISSFTYPWPIGSRFEYSNIGYGLLGYGLGRAAGSDLPTLIQKRIIEPLGLSSTYFNLPADLGPRLTPGHDVNLDPTGPWDHAPIFQGAGGMHSSAGDLLTFVSAAMGLTDTPLAPDFKAMLAVRRASYSNLFSAIGWTVMERDGQEMIFKGGGTGGYRSCIMFDPAKRLGVVVLSNTSDPDVCDIGWRVLDPHYPLTALHKQVALSGGVLDAEAGRYQNAAGAVVVVARNGDHLTYALPGSAPQPILPASKRLFFNKASQQEFAFDFGAESQTSPIRIVLFRGKGPEIYERVKE